jgi:hypothetical protein
MSKNVQKKGKKKSDNGELLAYIKSDDYRKMKQEFPLKSGKKGS